MRYATIRQLALVSLVSFSCVTCVAGLTSAQECAPSMQRCRFATDHPAMGIVFRFVVYASSEQQAADAFSAAVQRIDQLDQILSDYRADSEINRFCGISPHADFQKVSRELFSAAYESKRFSCLTDGAFDCTVGRLSRVWRAAIKRNRLPDEDQIAEAMASIGSEKMFLRAPCEIRLASSMQLDFGGIGQGIAADQVLKIFHAHGIDSALVDASGDIAVSAPPPDQPGWSIHVPSLDDTPDQRMMLSNGAVASSGDTQQSLVIGDRRYSHVVDPRSGNAVSQSAQVTVIASCATAADALSTAFSVVDPATAIEMAARDEIRVEARIVYRPEPSAAELAIVQTNGFANYMIK